MEYSATVKQVISGDTVIIAHPRLPVEKPLTLSGVDAPKIPKKDTPGEPFCWESREFLRKLVLGKEVTFDFVSKNPKTKHLFGNLYLGDMDVRAECVRNGWVTLKSEGFDDEVFDLRSAETKARQEKIGKFNDKAVPLVEKTWGSYDAEEYFEKRKNKPIRCIVEQVIDGSFFRLLDTQSGEMLLLRQTGIQCPNPNLRGDDSGPEPFSIEARKFSESRLLQREVNVVLELIDKSGFMLGCLFLDDGKDIFAKHLLLEGLARVIDWSAHLSSFSGEFRTFEREAREKRLNMWRGYVPPKGSYEGKAASEREFEVVVVNVISGDLISVRKRGAKDIAVVSLASIRAPRRDEPCSREAREFIRKLCIGRTCRMVLDYERTAPPSAVGKSEEKRVFVTLFVDERCVSVEVVAAGLANVIRHRSDEDRSIQYDNLMTAEKKAKEKKIGIHNPNPPKFHINDITNAGHGKARTFLDFLQRGGRVDAIVEYEFSASRFKLVIPRESLMVLFALEGVRCPMPKKRDRAAEPFGEEGLDLVRNTLHQREVQIVVRSIDRIGTFLGAMYVNDGEDNVAVSLLKNGFALLHEASVGKSPDARLLENAAKEASEKKLRLHSLSPAVFATIGGQKPVDDASSGAKLIPEKPEYIHITPTEVIDGARFYATLTDASKFEEIGRAIASLSLSTAPFRATEGSLCVAPFGDDGKMYRVKVVSINASAGTADVLYVDFGNKDTLPLRSLRAVPSAVSSIPFQAMLFRLAFIRVSPVHEQMGEESAFFLSGRVVETKMLAKVEYREKGSREVFVSLFDPESRKSIAAELVRNGLARVVDMEEPAFHETVAALRDEESKAKLDGLNLWQYGDYENEEEGAM